MVGVLIILDAGFDGLGLGLVAVAAHRQGAPALEECDFVGRVDLYDRSGDGGVVETYIGYLRRKIDTPFGRKAIETVRGVGYRLVPDGG